ncbi:exonuclease SbcCD subunit D [Cohnella endophytica]|uniref:Nuclease SbcCD subunit D n=1 Tax=Cohnella endophytica TaxID=2419778 RepID=A0A494XYM9_9BACL|nr:exonuclease SbcCD subunit D [Cohnella endophytica]RKP54149.1 exonuclease SbcCD subunit D [Cohnella endophytica]
MKFIHTADWHLGKLVQGVYMTEDQRSVLEQLIDAVEKEKPDAVVIAGDLYDRAIPPTEAVELLDELFEKIVIGLDTPLLAISGNHDSPDRLAFGTAIMEARGLHLAGQLKPVTKPVVLRDEFGEVHFHLVPYADPGQVRFIYGDEDIRSHDDAMKAIVGRIEADMDKAARQVFVGHAFVTPGARPEENTSQSERPLSIGGAEYVNSEHFRSFHYTALGHLHQAHHVANETIRYAGSPLKYSISEETHRKGFLIVDIDGSGAITVEKRDLKPRRDMRRVAAPIEEIERQTPNEDYVFVTLLNDDPVLFPMEKVRATYPNALHVERRTATSAIGESNEAGIATPSRKEADPVALFAAFYREVKGVPLTEEKQRLFVDAYSDVLREEGGAV